MKGPLLGLAGGALAISLLTAGCESAPAPPPQTSEWTQDFNTIEHYWEVTRGLGDLSVRLLIIKPGEKYVCGQNVFYTSSDSIGDYCAVDNSIEISETAYKEFEADYIAAGGDAEDLKYLLLGHEVGHALQDHFFYTAYSPSNIPKLNIKFEGQADCLDGEMMEGIDKSGTKAARILFSVTAAVLPGSVETHGSTGTRYAAYLFGRRKVLGVEQGCGLESAEVYSKNSHKKAGV